MSERRRTILIVEDNEDLRGLFRISLALAGYDVVEAADGIEALKRLDYAPPDLVVLDLYLPGVSGTVIQQEIAAQAHTRHIPIVVITGSSVAADELNVACFLRKPVLPDRLIESVRSCLAAGASGVS